LVPHLVAALGFHLALARPLPRPAVSLDSPAGGVLEPGSTVTVVWENVPPAVPECELLLVLGVGHTTLRITEELSPGSGSYRWTVPNVSAPAARLVLRMNLSGREVESPPSRPFAIAGSSDLARPSLQWRNEEGWLSDGEEEEAAGAAALPAGLGRATPSVVAFPMDTDDNVPPGGGLRWDDEGARDSKSTRTTPSSASARTRTNGPQCFPRRI
jgi:hypothetical protein